MEPEGGGASVITWCNLVTKNSVTETQNIRGLGLVWSGQPATPSLLIYIPAPPNLGAMMGFQTALGQLNEETHHSAWVRGAGHT